MSARDRAFVGDVGLLGALVVGVGTTIGAGIFVLPAVVFGRWPDADVLTAAFVLAAVVALCYAFVVAELGTAMARGTPTYWVTRGLGAPFGTIAGVAEWIGLAVVTAFYALGVGVYLSLVAPVPTLVAGPVSIAPERNIALLVVIVFVGVNYFGLRETGSAAAAVVGALVAILAAFVVGGVVFGSVPARPPMPDDTGTLLAATALVFVSYLGYAKVAAFGEELRDPERVLPIAVLGSVIAAGLLYVTIAAVLAGVNRTVGLPADVPAVVGAGQLLFGPYGTALTVGAGLIAMFTSVAFSVLASTRTSFALGRERLITGWFTTVHSRFQTPHRALEATGLVVIVAILLGDIATLAVIAVAVHMVSFGLVALTLVVCRLIEPTGYDPTFQAPAGLLIGVITVACSLVLLAATGPLAAGIAGGVVLLSLAWYASYGRRQETAKSLLMGYLADRSDELPSAAAAATRAVSAESSSFRVLVPVANPRTQSNLVGLGSAIAAARDGSLLIVHAVSVPDQMPLSTAPEHLERFAPTSEKLLEDARQSAVDKDVPVETQLVYGHRPLETIFELAGRQADLVVMGNRPGSSSVPGAAGVFDEFAYDLPTDVIALGTREFDPSKLLVPVTDTPHAALCTETAAALAQSADAEVTLLHVVDGESEREGGLRFLVDWAEQHDLERARKVVDIDGDLESSIAEHASEHTAVLIGAVDSGVLSRLARRQLALDVLYDLDCSVIVAERGRKRSLRERLFG